MAFSLTDDSHRDLFTDPNSGLSKGSNILLIFGTTFLLAGVVNDQALRLPEAFAVPAQAAVLSLLTLLMVQLCGGTHLGALLRAFTRGGSTRSALAWGAAGAVALPFLVAALEAFLRLARNTQTPAPGWVSHLAHHPAALLLAGLVSGFMVPLVEEILYRGVTLGWLEQRFERSTALFLSAFVFAACHFNAATLPHLVVMGLVFGFVYQRSHNLASSVITHAVWNLLTLFLSTRGHA